MAFGRLFGRGLHDSPARSLYLAIVEQARRAEFYSHCGVPDSVDGRFDLIALHVFLVLHRLRKDHPESSELAQALFDTMFLDMDQCLRELGVGDLGVGPRVKRMAQGLYGRIAAYESGLERPGADLAAALGRNLYGTVDPEAASIDAIATYMRREAGALEQQDLAVFLAGEVSFGAPPDCHEARAPEGGPDFNCPG